MGKVIEFPKKAENSWSSIEKILDQETAGVDADRREKIKTEVIAVLKKYPDINRDFVLSFPDDITEEQVSGLREAFDVKDNIIKHLVGDLVGAKVKLCIEREKNL